MPTKFVDIFRDAPVSRDARRRQMLADALRQSAQRPLGPQNYRGRIVPKISPWEGVAKLGTAFLAAHQQKKADEAREEDQEQYRADILAKFGLTGPSDKTTMMADMLSGTAPAVETSGTVHDHGEEYGGAKSTVIGNQTGYPTLGLPPELAAEMYARNPGAYFQAASQYVNQQPGIADVSPAKYTPESLAAFAQSGNYSALRPVGPDGEKVQDRLNEIGDDLRTESKDFTVQQSAFQRIQSAAAEPSAAGDLGLVFGIMKLFDPNSVVRESEQATARNAAGVPDQIRNTWNRVLTGEQLTPEQRADFVHTAQRIYNSAAETQSQRNQRYRQRALNANIPAELIDPILFPASQVAIQPQPSNPVEAEIAKLDAEIARLKRELGQ